MTTQSTLRFLAVPALLVCFTGEMHSQTTFATITGSTVDGTGAVIPGVTVTATNTQSKFPRLCSRMHRGSTHSRS